MIDNITPPLAPNTLPPKGKFARNELNQAYLNEIANSRRILLAAKPPPLNVVPLTDVDLDPDTAGLLFDAITTKNTPNEL